MASMSKSFTATGNSDNLLIRRGVSFTYSVSGTFVGTVNLEFSEDGGLSWRPLGSSTGSDSGTVLFTGLKQERALVRYRCSAFTSGTIVTSFTETTSLVVGGLKGSDGLEKLQITDAGVIIPGTLAVTGAATITGTTTPTGGVVASAGQMTRFSSFKPAALTTGTSTTPGATTVYLTQVFIPANCTLTGIAVSNGATVGTNKYIVALLDSSGAVLANSALAGTLTAGADVWQAIDFTAPVAVVGPRVFWIALYVNGTTDRFRTIPDLGAYAGLAGSATGQTFGTVATVTLPTTFTADKGPVSYTY